MTFWPLTNSDLPTNQTFHQFHDLYTELDLHRIMSGFHGAFATVVASQQGTLTLPDTWFRPPFWDLLMLQLLRPNSSNLPCLCSTFHLEYPLVLSRFYFKNVAKTTKRSFFLLYSICHQLQGNLHLDKSIVPWVESLITTQFVLFCPYVGYLPFWKIKKVWLLFHCKSSIVILSIYIFTLFYCKIEKNKKERQGNKL